MVYQKTGWTDSNELQLTNSTLNEGTNSLINEQIRVGIKDGLSCIVAQRVP